MWIGVLIVYDAFGNVRVSENMLAPRRNSNKPDANVPDRHSSGYCSTQGIITDQELSAAPSLQPPSSHVSTARQWPAKRNIECYLHFHHCMALVLSRTSVSVSNPPCSAVTKPLRSDRSDWNDRSRGLGGRALAAPLSHRGSLRVRNVPPEWDTATQFTAAVDISQIQTTSDLCNERLWNPQ